MSGIEFIENLIADVHRHNVALLCFLAWNCLLTTGVIIALTRVDKDKR
jgi:hypothetical protein